MWIEGSIKPWTTEYIIQRAKDDKEIKKLVLHQAKLANKANLDAIVCSAQEVAIVKKIFKHNNVGNNLLVGMKEINIQDNKDLNLKNNIKNVSGFNFNYD